MWCHVLVRCLFLISFVVLLFVIIRLKARKTNPRQKVMWCDDCVCHVFVCIYALYCSSPIHSRISSLSFVPIIIIIMINVLFLHTTSRVSVATLYNSWSQQQQHWNVAFRWGWRERSISIHPSIHPSHHHLITSWVATHSPDAIWHDTMCVRYKNLCIAMLMQQ